MFFFMYGLYVICLMLIELSIVFENDRFQKRVFRFRKKTIVLKSTHSFLTFRKRITSFHENDQRLFFINCN